MLWLDLRLRWLLIWDDVGQVVCVRRRKLPRELTCSIPHIFRHVCELVISVRMAGRPRHPELEVNVNGRPFSHDDGGGNGIAIEEDIRRGKMGSSTRAGTRTRSEPRLGG